MKLPYLLFLFVLLLTSFAFGQSPRQVSGIVKDSTGTTVIGATVKLLMPSDTLATSTNTEGVFTFRQVPSNEFSVFIQSIGYQALQRQFVLNNDNSPAQLGTFILKTESRVLQGVTVTDVNPVKLKEDTVEFNANAYKVREGAPVEDMLKKMPGVDIDKNGNVTAQGKSVTKVRVNGKDFFGGDVRTATQNLPADIVQSIQVIDDYGDQANLTGVKTGEPDRILNINIRKDKNYGYFGQGTAGEGSDAQQQLMGGPEDNRYVASGNFFKFKDTRQIAVLANLNNTNTNLFTFGGRGPGGGGRGRRGGRGGMGGGTSNSNGITTARSIGLNYRDQWGKKVTVYGNYSFSNNTVSTLSSMLQSNTSLTQPSLNAVNSNQKDDNTNHRFNFNLEYQIDSLNYLKVMPSFTYGGINTSEFETSNLSRNDSTVLNYDLNSRLKSHTPNFGGNVLYNHRFKTKGRNFSINAGAGSVSLTQTQNPVYNFLAGIANAPANQLISTDVNVDSVGASVSYMEPLGKRSFAEASYAYHYAYTSSDKLTDTLTSGGGRDRYDLLSNSYNYTFITNRVGLSYRFIEKKYNYTLGLAAEPAILNGNSAATNQNTHVTTFNIAPTARFVYNIARNQSFTINYHGSNDQPGYSQLQPVTDFSSASYPVQGNPYLKPEFNNRLALRYNKFSFETGNIFFMNLSFSQTNNRIVANSVTYPREYAPDPRLAGTILTQYLNADGFYSASGSYVYAKPWQKRKYTLFFNGNITYNNNISYISNVAPVTYAMTTDKNIAKNFIVTQGTRFRVDIEDIIDAEANASYSITTTNNSLPRNNINNNFRTINLGVSGKNYFWKDWTLNYDYSKVIYQGFQGATDPNILNAYVERRFLKGNSGALRFSVYDIFNQNTGFSTTQTGTYITQSQANRLGRYFLLTFTLRLQKFSGQRPGFRGGPGGGGQGGRGFGGR